MDKYIITISRQFGSLGRPIAKRLSEILGIEFYDRDIIEETAKQLGKGIKTVSNIEEKANYRYMLFPLGNTTTEEQDRIFSVESRIIEELSEKESCIIVGRCGDYILRDKKNVVSIYIYSSQENRFRNCVEMLHIDEKEARKMMREVDRKRNAYYKHYTGFDQDDLSNYNLAIDSNLLGVEKTAQYLAELIVKYWL